MGYGIYMQLLMAAFVQQWISGLNIRLEHQVKLV